MKTVTTEELAATADQLSEKKVESIVPVPLTKYESMLYSTIHLANLPTIKEIYKDISMKILKCVIFISLLLAVWWLLSVALDEISHMFGC